MTEKLNFWTLAKATIVFGFSGAVAQAVSLLIAPILTRYLSPAEYGTLALLTVSASIAGIFMGMGFRQAGSRDYYEADDKDKPTALSTSFFTMVLIGLLVCIVLSWFSRPLSTFILGNDKYAFTFFLAMVNAYISQLALLPSALLRVKGEVNRAVRTNLVVVLVTVTTSLLLVVGFRRGVHGMVEANLLGTAVNCLLLWSVIRPYLKLEINYDKWKGAARYGIPFVPHTLCSMLMDGVDRYLIKIYVSISEVGIYAIASRLTSPIDLLINAMQQATMPQRYLVYKEPDKLSVYTDICKYAVGAVVLCGLILSLFGKEIVMLLFPSSYWGSAKLIPLFCLAAFFRTLYYYTGATGVDQVRKTYFYPLFTVSALIVNVIANWFLIRSFGITGAAWASIIGAATLFAVSFGCSQYHFKISYPWSFIITALISAVLIFAVLFMIQEWSFFLALIIKVLLVCLLALFCLQTNVIKGFLTKWRTA